MSLRPEPVHDHNPKFDALYQTYSDRIYRFCCRLCRSESDAEDLAQEVFVAAYRGLAKFEGRAALTTWLYRIALYRWRRMYGNTPPDVSLDTSPTELPAPDFAVSALERMTLDTAIYSLPPLLREAFLLVKAEGLTYREAAAVLETPQGTVQSRVHQAMTYLRNALRTEPSQPSPSQNVSLRSAAETGAAGETAEPAGAKEVASYGM